MGWFSGHIPVISGSFSGHFRVIFYGAGDIGLKFLELWNEIRGSAEIAPSGLGRRFPVPLAADCRPLTDDYPPTLQPTRQIV